MNVRTRSVYDAVVPCICFTAGLLVHVTLWAFVLVGSAAHAQTPILQPKPQFKAGVPIKQGTFTLVIYEKGLSGSYPCLTQGNKITCDPLVPEGMIVIGSSDPKVTSAIVEVFYQAYVEGIKSKGPLLLHQQFTCPIITREPIGACDQNLSISADAVKFIRIKGSAEIESVQIGAP